MSAYTNEANLANPTVYRDLSRILLRDWISILHPSEFTLVCFVFDRTIGWCKDWEYITWEHFMTGVYGEDGCCYNKGTGMPRSTLAKMLKSLLDGGFLLQRKSPSGAIKYAVAFDRKPRPDDMFRTFTKESASISNRPSPKSLSAHNSGATEDSTFNNILGIESTASEEKTLENRSIEETFESPTETPESTTGTLRDTERKEVSRKRETDVMPNPADSANLLFKILKKSKLKAKSQRGGTMAKLDTKKDDLEHLYHMTWIEFYPDIPYEEPKGKTMIILRAYSVRFRKNPSSPIPFSKFLNWLFEKWPLIMKESFHWMSDVPETPRVEFFVRHSGIFEGNFARREELKTYYSMSYRDRQICDLVQKEGMNLKLATETVDERLNPKLKYQ